MLVKNNLLSVCLLSLVSLSVQANPSFLNNQNRPLSGPSAGQVGVPPMLQLPQFKPPSASEIPYSAYVQGRANQRPIYGAVFEPASSNNFIQVKRIWNKEFAIPGPAQLAKAQEDGLMIGERFTDEWKNFATVGANKSYTLEEIRNGAKLGSGTGSGTRRGVNLSILDEGSYLEKAIKYAEFPADVFTVVGHGVAGDVPMYDEYGNPTGQMNYGYTLVEGPNSITSRFVSPRELYELMKANGYKDGQDFMLVSCKLGAKSAFQDKIYAEQLAKVIRDNSTIKTAKIYAATETIWLNMEGNYIIAPVSFTGGPAPIRGVITEF